ncbi:MAG: AAA family ATPase [Methanomassiliicoccus sp.]|nr:AAA family ATPase [Methanomassiliicoccus sp.]
MRKVFILTGMPGAGKEEFVKVAQELGYRIVRMGDVVRQEAERREVAMDDRGVGGFADSERRLHGPAIWAERCLAVLGDGDFVIDGSRSLMELEAFRRSLGKSARLVAVHTSPDERFRRLQLRGRRDAPRDRSEFDERDARELGWGIGSLIALAGTMLVNEGALYDFRTTARNELERAW